MDIQNLPNFGNGSADGPFVSTGFRPAWVLIKNTAEVPIGDCMI